jgi:hypothetical protein
MSRLEWVVSGNPSSLATPEVPRAPKGLGGLYLHPLAAFKGGAWMMSLESPIVSRHEIDGAEMRVKICDPSCFYSLLKLFVRKNEVGSRLRWRVKS